MDHHLHQKDHEHEDEKNEAVVQPLIEMSQDCVVEWNESQPSVVVPPSCCGDASTPLTHQSGRTPPTTSSRSSRSSSSSHRGGVPSSSLHLSQVRRQLEQQRGSTTTTTEEEIDGIFSLLQQQQQGSSSSSWSHHGPTQRIQNRNHPATTTAITDSSLYPPPRPALSSLASRRRRRRRETQDRHVLAQEETRMRNCRPKRVPRQQDNEDASVAAATMAVTSTACKTPPPTRSSHGGTGTGGGAFDSLLKQLRPPLIVQDKENPPHDASLVAASRRLLSPCSKSISNSSSSQHSPPPAAVARKESRTPLAIVAETDKLSTTTTPFATTTTTRPKTKITTPDEFGDFDMDMDMLSHVDQLVEARQRLAQMSAVNVSRPPSSTTTSAEPVPTKDPSTSTSTTTIASHTKTDDNEEDDEFGDFPDIDFELLEEAARKRTTQQNENLQTKSDNYNNKTVPPSTTKADEEDEFGDFPDIDLNVIDQAIATRSLTQPSNSSLPSNKDALTSSLVRNLRASDPASSDPSGLSFIKFSRYKVLNIHVDTRLYYKTVQVAEWKDVMLQDDEAEVNIHRNAHVVVTQYESTKDVPPSAVGLPAKSTRYPEAGFIQLRGQWYYSDLEPGDAIHICSLTGRFRTDANALPIVLHSHPPPGSEQDDLVIIHHPDLLMTPTVISETVACPRRAVLKQRNGSSGLTAPAALIGTLRHALFGWCMKEKNFEHPFVVQQTKKIIRENAEAMVGCGVTTQEAERQLLETMPVLLDFVKEHTTFLSPDQAAMPPHAFVNGHIGSDKGVRFAAHTTYSLEEPVVSPELALKGFVDAVVETTTMAVGNENNRNQHTITGLKHSLMALELKTGHNQTSQHTHMGQLSLYTLMLQARYGVQLKNDMLGRSPPITTGKPDPKGAASGGLLLYLNHQDSKAAHVAPEFDEFKSLIAQRNVIASQFLVSSKPRGVSLAYEVEKPSEEGETKKVLLMEPAPPVVLPDVQQSERSCTRCFENQSCMLYARSETEVQDPTGVKMSHSSLLTKYTGQLQQEDLEYFRKWDRLVDLEAHATVGNTALAWLRDSQTREKVTGETISSLVYEGPSLSSKNASGVLLRFKRSPLAFSQSNLDGLSIGIGAHVVVSTDGSIFDDSQSDPKLEYMNTQREQKKFRQRMNIVRGFLKEASASEVVISAKHEDLDQIQNICDRFSQYSGNSEILFRVDKDNSAVGIGTLRQNLINLFTGDHSKNGKEDATPFEVAKQIRFPRLRDFIVRLRPPCFRDFDDAFLFRDMGPRLPGCDPSVLAAEFLALNKDQQDAVRKVIATNDYVIVEGYPGTGKTKTLSFIARLLAARGKRVLISSYTNAAVDNVVMKLLESGVCANDPSFDGISRLVRVGPRHSCHENARVIHAHDIATDLDARASGASLSQASPKRPRAESLSRVVAGARIICSTVLTVPRSPLLVNETFDVVIVDEAGQTSQPAVLGALMAADSFVLVGDHKQLPPLVNSEVAQAGGYGESLLTRLANAHPTSIAALTYQYRMNEEICKLSSQLTYEGVLKCGNDVVKQRRLNLPGFPRELPPIAEMNKGLWPWLKMTISPGKPVIFVDTDSMRKTSSSSNENQSGAIEALEEKQGGRAGGKVTNPTEASIVRYIIHGLVATGLSPSDIGIISPFRAQVQLLEESAVMAQWKKRGLEISTIDRYQGRDKPVIILSFVRSNPGGHAGRLLQDRRRLNVALTRAKAKLILVGSFSTLSAGSAPLNTLLHLADSKKQRQLLPENALQCYRFQ